MMFFKKKKKRVELDDPSRNTINALNKLKRKTFHVENMGQLNEIIRFFLKEEYNFSRALTTEEIIKKLKSKQIHKKAKIEIAYILQKIYHIEYKSNIHLTKKPFNELIDEIKISIKKIFN